MKRQIVTNWSITKLHAVSVPTRRAAPSACSYINTSAGRIVLDSNPEIEAAHCWALAALKTRPRPIITRTRVRVRMRAAAAEARRIWSLDVHDDDDDYDDGFTEEIAFFYFHRLLLFFVAPFFFSLFFAKHRCYLDCETPAALSHDECVSTIRFLWENEMENKGRNSTTRPVGSVSTWNRILIGGDGADIKLGARTLERSKIDVISGTAIFQRHGATIVVAAIRYERPRDVRNEFLVYG